MPSLSKSLIKAMGCPTYYAQNYLRDDVVQTISSELAETGTGFHNYRALYATHLINTRQRSDELWAVELLDRITLTDDARKMALADIPFFRIDPDLCFGAELYLSVREDWQPHEMKFGGVPGQRPTDLESWIHGTIDLLHLDGDEARVDDYKTGWSNQTVSEYEPAHYASLVFAHFPQVEKIRFKWEFLRAASREETTLSRQDLDWLHGVIRAQHSKENEIRTAFLNGRELPVNPYAGLCGFCSVNCPLKVEALSGRLDIPPIQNDEAAEFVAARLFVADLFIGRARELLLDYLKSRGMIRLEGSEFVAEAKGYDSSSYPLLEALGVIGIRLDPTLVPEEGALVNSPLWDIPLSGLTISGLSDYAKAKKRKGMQEALFDIAKIRRSYRVQISRREPSLEDLLTQSIEAARTPEAVR